MIYLYLHAKFVVPKQQNLYIFFFFKEENSFKEINLHIVGV